MADQKFFDGTPITSIPDDHNIGVREPNATTPGSKVISWANLKALLNSVLNFIPKVGGAVAGNVPIFDSEGNLVDSGQPPDGGGGQSEYELFDITPVANVLTVTFDADKMSADYNITDAFEIQRAVTGNLRGKIVHLIATADGNIAHKPAFSTDFSLRSDNWNNTNGVKNIITMKYLNDTSKSIIEYSEL